jgi:hypothetical protein
MLKTIMIAAGLATLALPAFAAGPVVPPTVVHITIPADVRNAVNAADAFADTHPHALTATQEAKLDSLQAFVNANGGVITVVIPGIPSGVR